MVSATAEHPRSITSLTIGQRHETDEESFHAATLLDHLNDQVNRRFLGVMSLDWYTAKELTAVCDTPLSTTYRKLNALDDVGLLERRIRLDTNGKHPEEFRCRPVILTCRLGESTGIEMIVRAVEREATDR